METIFTGHGNEVKHVNDLIDRRLSRQHERAMKVKAMVTGQPLTAFDICKQLFPHAYERELSLTMSETIGQIDYLQSLGEIAEMEDDDGKKCYICN
ncbi:hypothetical protein [Bacillus kwashiorkori]|uniref:hypothetical protein n=1 Tax=Bacillus kwashiorkori TaxID=1522318 RepID=UPI000783D252|nr:hypothetical protein [Bacillus kwashiorkori]